MTESRRPRNREFRVAVRPYLHAIVKAFATRNRFRGSSLDSISAIMGAAISEWIDAGMPDVTEPPILPAYIESHPETTTQNIGGVQTTFRLATEPYAERYMDLVIERLREDSLGRNGARLRRDEVSAIVFHFLHRHGVVDAPGK